MQDDMMIRQRVIDELDFDPAIDPRGIGVAVREGVATLTGHVESLPEKLAATHAAQRVSGVRGVATEIEVRLPNAKKRHDDEIARRATDILAWALDCAPKIQVAVEDGWVTLRGEVDWRYQRADAERMIRLLGGVRGLTDSLVVRPKVEAMRVRESIQKAFTRNAALEGAGVTVGIDGSTVTLGGKVKTWHERAAAEDAAWSVPGVTEVHNHVTIS